MKIRKLLLISFLILIHNYSKPNANSNLIELKQKLDVLIDYVNELKTSIYKVYQPAPLSVKNAQPYSPNPILPLSATKAQLNALNAILQKDDVAQLINFIKNNPSFNWNILTNISWKKETSTPLITAVVYNASQCAKYLLDNNVGNIRSSIKIQSSHKLLPIQYTQNNPKHYHSNNEIATMQTLLQTYS